MPVRFLAWGLLGVLGAWSLAAQPLDPSRLRFVTYTPDDGLPHATVLAITRDARGFLWVGTLDGLARFDGRRFETFRPDPGVPGTLSDGLIHGLHPTPDGGLWVGTRGDGLNYFDPRTEAFRTFAGLPDAYVASFAVRADGRVWVFTSREACLLDPRSGACPRVRWEGPGVPAAGEPFVASLIARDGRFWLATARALYRATGVLEPASDAVGVALERIPLPAELSTIARLAELDDGSVWVGTLSEGLVHLHPDGTVARYYRVGTRAPYRLGADETSVWFHYGGWIWASGGRLLLIDPDTGAMTAVPYEAARTGDLDTYRPSSAYRDPDGAVWIGTWGGGLKRLVAPPPFGLLRRTAGGLQSDFVLSVAEDAAGRLWVGTDAGLDRFDAPETPATPVLAAGRSACTGGVWDVYPRPGAVWIGTRQGGLCVLDDEGARPVGADVLVSRDVRVVRQDGRGWLWVGHTEGGLQIVERPEALRHGEPTRVHALARFARSEVVMLYEAPTGEVWVGTKKEGAFRLRVVGGWSTSGPEVEIEQLPVGPSGTPHPDVRAFWQAPDSTVWMATYGGGIAAWHAGRAAHHVGRAEGLPNTFTYAVLPDAQGHLWVPTNSGLARYDLATGVVRTFTRRDGIQDDEFNTGAWHAGATGRLYAGGVSGLSVWRPEEIEPPGVLPPVYLTGLRVFDRAADLPAPLPHLKTVTLRHDENFITLDYTTPALAEADRVRYRYRLLGEDPAPVEAGSRTFATYTNLAPGRYRFAVEAYHLDAPTAVQRAELALVIAPPWWRTRWFYALALTLLLGGLVLLVRWASTRKLRARVRALETERRLQAERARISRDLHDHVGAQLTSLASGLELAEAYARHERPDERDATLRSLQAEARHTIAQLRGTIWTLSDEPVPLRRFAEQAVRYAQDQARYAPGLRVEASRDVDDRALLPAQALHLYRIVQEAVQNTLKHASASRLVLSIHADERALRVTLRDDGRFAEQAPGNGLRNMRQRAAEIGAEFSLDTDEGTAVRVVLPLGGSDGAASAGRR